MDWERVKILHDRYLKAETSLDEERELYTLLSTAESLPRELQATKTMLEALHSIAQDRCDITIRHQEPRRRSISLRRIASIAASVVVVAGITLAMLLTPIESKVAEPMIVCHINGTMVDDQLIAQAEVQRILGGVSKNMHTAKERIDNITRITSNKQL